MFNDLEFQFNTANKYFEISFSMPSVKSSLKSINPECVCVFVRVKRAFYANLIQGKEKILFDVKYFFSRIHTKKNMLQINNTTDSIGNNTFYVFLVDIRVRFSLYFYSYGTLNESMYACIYYYCTIRHKSTLYSLK